MSLLTGSRCVALAATFAALPAALANSYAIVDLGHLHRPAGINRSGDVVGDIARDVPPDNDLAIVFRDGRWHRLPSGGSSATARGIDAGGTVVGNVGPEPVVWPQASGFQPVALPAGARSGDGNAIADDGTVVGDYTTAARELHCFRTTPDGVAIDLGLLHDGTYCVPMAINRKGWIAGDATIAHGWQMHAFLWHEGRMFDIGILPGDRFIQPLAVDDAGRVVGVSLSRLLRGHGRAFLWSDGRMKELGANSGFADTGATGLDAQGGIVGYASRSGEHLGHAVRFVDGGGVVLLESEVAGLGDWRLERATAVNADGVIVGYGHLGGRAHGFMLVPQAAASPSGVGLQEPK